jgi:hypothetical protein
MLNIQVEAEVGEEFIKTAQSNHCSLAALLLCRSSMSWVFFDQFVFCWHFWQKFSLAETNNALYSNKWLRPPVVQFT